MIYNSWYVIASSKEIKKDKPLFLTRLNKKLALWRDTKGEVCCIDDKCCHRGASISHGKIIGDNIACPFHGFQFDKSGKTITIPANGKCEKVGNAYKVQGYKIKEEYDFIWLWYGESDKAHDILPFPDNLKDKSFSYSSLVDYWNCHYSRCIENQLDPVHVPFVHSTTIGKGNKTVINGPVVELEKENRLLRFYVENVTDHCQKALLDSQMTNYKEKTYIEFYFPNTWQNIISKKMRVFIAFSPVDENNTVIYLRYYQNIITAPIVKELFNLSGIKYSKIILNQDKKVVMTQPKEATSSNMHEILIRGDRPISEYRQFRDSLKNENNK